jgi:hypothetical protein
MVIAFDLVCDGLVKSLVRFGRNITGRTNVSVELGYSILKMLHGMAPNLPSQ